MAIFCHIDYDLNVVPTVMLNGNKFAYVKAIFYECDSNTPETRKRRLDGADLDEESGATSKPKRRSLLHEIFEAVGNTIKLCPFLPSSPSPTYTQQNLSGESESENRRPQSNTSKGLSFAEQTKKEYFTPRSSCTVAPTVRNMSSDRRSSQSQSIMKELVFLCEYGKFQSMMKKFSEEKEKKKKEVVNTQVKDARENSEPPRFVKIRENTFQINFPQTAVATSLLSVSSARETTPVTPGMSSVKKKVAYVKGIIRSQQERKILNVANSQAAWADDVANDYKRMCTDIMKKINEKSMNLKLFDNVNNRLIEEVMARRYEETLKTKILVALPEEEVIEYPELTEEMKMLIDDWLIPYPGNDILCQFHGLNISRTALNCLSGLNWLNDDVINMYMELLMERSKQDVYPSVYAFNSFFFPKVMQGGQSAVRRWTRKVDVFNHEFIVIPCHLGIHWTVMIVDFKKKQILYYDSIGNPNSNALDAAMKYLIEEHLDKKKVMFNTQGWDLVNVKGSPQQKNGSDCGVFSCITAEHVTRRAKLTFSQKLMPYFRKKMVYEIVKKELLT